MVDLEAFLSVDDGGVIKRKTATFTAVTRHEDLVFQVNRGKVLRHVFVPGLAWLKALPHRVVFEFAFAHVGCEAIQRFCAAVRLDGRINYLVGLVNRLERQGIRSHCDTG